MKKLKPKRYENSDPDEMSFVEFVEYDFITIQKATNNFSETNKVGGGGFGVVYKGTLEDGEQVVVKRLSKNLRKDNLAFKKEVALMGKFQHRNLVRLLGFSLEGKEVLLAWTHLKGGSASNVIDPMLRGIKSPVDEITKCIHIALLCVQESVTDRPKMAEILQMLSNLSMSLPVPLAPGFCSEASSQFTKNAKSVLSNILRKMQKKKAKSYAKTVEESSSSVEISHVESHLKYELITIQNATNNFSEANKLGVGRYGAVYKGKLENGLEVAVKRLSKYSALGNLAFKNEVALIAKLQHRNLVRLFGYCQEGREIILVYEFLPNGGLDGFLFGK
nr:putative receptor-like protein kinase At4g00960 [Ipomoea batatas]